MWHGCTKCLRRENEADRCRFPESEGVDKSEIAIRKRLDEFLSKTRAVDWVQVRVVDSGQVGC